MKIRTLSATLVAATLLVAACGDDSSSGSDSASASDTTPEVSDAETAETTTDAPSTSTTDTAADTTVPVETSAPVTSAASDTTAVEPDGDVATAIVSMSPTATEMLYAIDAGDQVIAVDNFSNYPPEAADKMTGIDAFTPNVEAVADLEPDLVVTDGTNPDFLAQLDELGIAHWEGPAATSFDDVYTQIEQLGAATGKVGEAAEVVLAVQTELDEVIANLPQLDEPLTYYHELDATFYAVTSGTFIGAVYAELGLENIADQAEGGIEALYPQLNPEFIIEQGPDLIFNACSVYCETTADDIAARPGWDAIPAVQNDAIVDLDDDIASRWGPRITELLAQVGDAVTAVAPVAAG